MDTVKVKITNLRNRKVSLLEGDPASVEQQLRDMFPVFSSRFPPGDLVRFVYFVAGFQYYYVSADGLDALPEPQGIQPDNRPDPRLEDPWRREGDNPETMNNVRLDRT